jgi:hypothetical protein
LTKNMTKIPVTRKGFVANTQPYFLMFSNNYMKKHLILVFGLEIRDGIEQNFDRWHSNCIIKLSNRNEVSSFPSFPPPTDPVRTPPPNRVFLYCSGLLRRFHTLICAQRDCKEHHSRCLRLQLPE